jgi:Fungal Zn(2)-Cys(6) binuclear cluster domain
MDEEGSPIPEWREGASPRGQTSLHEPACDQCRIRKVRCNREHPKCSNCKKAKVPCGFSSRGKRVNHTKQLYVQKINLCNYIFFCMDK